MSSLRGTKQSLNGGVKVPEIINYILVIYPYGLHKTHSILLLAKLVPRYRSQ